MLGCLQEVVVRCCQAWWWSRPPWLMSIHDFGTLVKVANWIQGLEAETIGNDSLNMLKNMLNPVIYIYYIIYMYIYMYIYIYSRTLHAVHWWNWPQLDSSDGGICMKVSSKFSNEKNIPIPLPKHSFLPVGSNSRSQPLQVCIWDCRSGSLQGLDLGWGESSPELDSK